MAFLVASASIYIVAYSIWIPHWRVSYFSVCIIIIIIIRNLYSAIMPLGGYRGEGSSAMIDNHDNVVYERSVPKCVKMDYLQQQKIQKNWPTLLGSSSPPHSKILGTPLLCPVLKMKSRRLCICVSCHFVCILGTCEASWFDSISNRTSDSRFDS